MPYYDNFKSIQKRQNLEDKVQQDLRAVGLDQFSQTERAYRQSANDLGNYLSGGQYTSADNQRYRDQATKAIADLDEQLKTYKPSSDEYKQLKSYKDYYAQAYNNLGYVDVGTRTQEYVGQWGDMGFDNWHSEDDYKAQRAYLDEQRSALQAKIDAEKKKLEKDELPTSADLETLQEYMASYDDMYAMLDARNEWDRLFDEAGGLEAFTAYKKSGDYKYSTDLEKTVAEKQSELDAKTKELTYLESKFGAPSQNLGVILQNAANAATGVDKTMELVQDAQGYDRMLQLKKEVDQLRADLNAAQGDLDRVRSYQAGTVLSNYGGVYDPKVNWEKEVDKLKDAYHAAEGDEVSQAKIRRQIETLAGANWDGTDANGLYDDQSWLGRWYLQGIDVEKDQAEYDKLAKELSDRGAAETKSGSWVHLLAAAAQDAQGANVFVPGGSQSAQAYVAELDPELDKMRDRKQELWRNLESARNYQTKAGMSGKYGALGEEQQAALTAAGKAAISEDGKSYTDANGQAHRIKNLEYLTDDDAELRDQIYAAIGAELSGFNLGYTADEIADAYSEQMKQIGGRELAKRDSEIESDWKRWNKQVLGVGNAAGLNQFWQGMQQAAVGLVSDERVEKNRLAYRAQYTREDLKRYGDEVLFGNSGVGGSNISQLLFDTAQTTANMVPMIVASAIATKMGAPEAVAGLVGSGLMSVSSAGNSYQQALSEGWEKDDAKMFAIVTGAAEGGLQYLLGGIPELGGLGSEPLLKLAERIGDAGLRVATKTSLHISSETVEELLQNRIERYLRWQLSPNNESADWASWNEDDWYTVMVTALSTGLLEGPGEVMNTARAKKLGGELSGKIIPSKGFTKQQKERNDTFRYIGSKMKGEETLAKTLITVGKSMTEEGSLANQLANGMDSGKLEKSDMNYGRLYAALTEELADESGALGYDVAAAAVIGGAVYYNGVKQAKADLNAEQATHKEMVKASPEATVLDQTATELTNLGVHDASIALEYSAIINNILNGHDITHAELTKLMSRSNAARAARLLLSQRNPSLSGEGLDRNVVRTAVNQIAADMRAIRKQQAELADAGAVQAAMDAVRQTMVNDAAARAEVDPTKMPQALAGLQASQNAIDTTQAKLNALENTSFKDLGRIDSSLNNQLVGVENAAAYQDLQKKLASINEKIDAIQKTKVPSKAQQTELGNLRQQRQQIRQQMAELNRLGVENIKQLAKEAEAAGKAEGEAAPNTSGVAPAAGDYYVDPTGQVRTREQYIATKTAQGMTEEEANAEFDRDAEMAGGVKHGQTTDNAGTGEDALGRRGESGEDRQRGDRSVRPGEQGANGKRHPIRPQTDGLGQRREAVDDSAVVTDSKDVSSLGEEYSWLEDLTDRLKESGFQYINYVTKGTLYNKAGQPVPALCIGREMFLVVDGGSRGFVDAIARHEDLHMRLNLLEAQYGRTYRHMFVTGALQKLMTTEQYLEAYRKYSNGDEAHPGGYGRAYEDVEQEERIHMINEEILCDMVGGLTTFKDLDLGKYQEGAWQFLSESNFDEVTSRLANPDLGAPGELISAEDLGVFPHNVPKDTLLSDQNVDSPSTEVADIQTVSRDAKYGFAKALGFYVDGTTKSWYRSKEDAKAQRNGFTEFATEQVEDSPLANLINWAVGRGISEESAKRQLQLFVGLGQIVDKTNNFHMAMQMFGSSLFTAMKLNSDNQYGTSEDVANICTKTQSVIDYMSEEMKRVKRGLTDDEILEIYRRIEAEGLPVNCPECYVFSRWIGIGGLLDNIYQYQNLYKNMTPEQVAAEHARLYQKVLDEQADKKKKYIETATTREKDPLTLEEAQAEAEKKFTLGKVRSNMVKTFEDKYKKLTDTKADLEAQGKELSQKDADQLAEYEANITPLRSLVWIEKVYFGGKVAFNDKGQAPAGIDLASKVNPHFEVPSDVLFDLNAGEEFAYRYPEAWAFRTTQGAGYGKAITPTAEAHLGESIMVTNNTGYLKAKQNAARKYQGDDELERHEASVAKNIFYTEKGPITPKSDRGKALTKAIKKELNQLFLGGQRLQSTSDSRYDTAIDTLLIAVELQAMRAGAQIYTKVLGAVPFYDSINGFVNMSMMPLVYGRMAGKQISGGLDENGNPVDSPVGGVNPKLIEEYRKKYPHAGTITIGVNDQHIRAMFNQVIRDFIIPYHASGGKTEIVAEMRRIQDKALTQGRTDMPQSTDYTLTQTDKFLSDTALRKDMGYTEERIEEAKRFREMRLWILTGKGTPHMDLLQAEGIEGLTRAQKSARKILAQLYKSIHDEGGRWHGVQLAKGKVDHQIFPNEFWDTSANYEDSGVNTQRYLDYCEALGVLHRFSGQGVKRGRVVPVNGYNAKGEQTALTDLAYQIDKNGNYIKTLDEEGNEVRVIEPFFWKTLVDRRMYDNEGNYMEQTPVTLNGLVGLDNENAEEAVAAGVDLIANPQTGFAKPVEGDRPYDRKKSLKLAEQPVARSALAESEDTEEAPVFQGRTSKKTSINSSKLPKLFTNKGAQKLFKDGNTNIDIGGGQFDNTTNYLKDEFGVTNYVFDPYNRDRENNLKVLNRIRNGELFDTATCSNVLNVIDTAEARSNVILEMAKSIKPDGVAIFRMYANKDEEGPRETKTDQWQEFRSAETYMPEIEQWFNDVKPGTDGVIYARDPKANLPQAAWEIEQGKAIRYSMALSESQQKNKDFNDRQTEVGSGLRTLNSDKAMTRSKTKVDGVPANVGKQMGDQIWVHKNYAERVVPKAELNRAESVLREKFPNFQYNTIMYDKKTGNIRFDEAPNFDTAREPIPGGMVTVMPNGDTKVGYSDNIWHHKWMWVDNDYKGFDVADSWNWSKQWLSTLQEVANGSTRGPVGWNQQMDKYGLPTDPASDVEIKDRKAEIARIEGKPAKPIIPAKNKAQANTTPTQRTLSETQWRDAVKNGTLEYTEEMEKQWGLYEADMRRLDEAMVEYLDAIDRIHEKGSWTSRDLRSLRGWDNYTDFVQNLEDRPEKAQKYMKFMMRNLDRQALNDMLWFNIEVINSWERNDHRKAINQFKKIIAEQKKTLPVEGKNLNVDNRRDYTLTEIRTMFEELNTNKETGELAQKVFDWAEHMSDLRHPVPFKFRAIPHPKDKQISGQQWGGKVKYDTNYFNNPEISDNKKAQTILHELIHVYSAYAIDAVHNWERVLDDPSMVYARGYTQLRYLYEDLTPGMIEAVHTLDNIWEQIRYDPDFYDSNGLKMYGTTNTNEMVAELANPEFRDKLKQKSLLQRILDAVKRLFGISTNNAYDAVSAAFDKLMTSSDNLGLWRDYQRFNDVTFGQEYANYKTESPPQEPQARYALTGQGEGSTIDEKVQTNFENLKGALDNVDRDGNGERSEPYYTGGELKRIESLFGESEVTRGEDRKLLCDAIRRAGGISQRTVSDGSEVDAISQDFLTKEMLLAREANLEHGYDTVFYVGWPRDFLGDYEGLNGFADTDNNVAYVRADTENDKSRKVTKNSLTDTAPLGTSRGIVSTRTTARHERFHLLRNSGNGPAVALLNYIDKGKNVKYFNEINYWYQRTAPVYDRGFDYYSEEIAADLYAGNLLLENKEARKEVQRLIDKIDQGTEHGARYSLANPAPDPEHQLFDDLLGVAQSNDPDLIADWVHAQLDKSEQAKEANRLRPPTIPSRNFVPRVTDSENAVLDKAIAGLIQKHGAHKPSEKNANGFIIPKKNAEGQRTSRAVQNIGSAKQVDAYVKEIKRFAVTDEAATYLPTTNAEQIEHAKDIIKEDGFDTAFKQFDRYINDPTFGFKEGYQWGTQLHSMIALGQQLLIEAGVNNDVRKVLELTANLTLLESEAGKSLQAARLLKMSGPIGELMYAQKVVNKLNKQYKKMIEGGRLAEIKIDAKYSDAVVNAPTREAREEALKELKQHIADQLPVSWMDRWNAWRYLSMLGNVRTHIRNVLGNAIFVPMRFTKDLMSAGGEFILTKAGIMDETDRTKAARVNKEYLAFAQEDAEVMKQELQGNGKYNPVNELMAARKVLPGVLDKINRINSDGIGEGYGIFSKLLVGLEGEDWAFLAPAYSKALAMALQHSGYTVEQLQGEGGPAAAKALNKARALAIEEAQRATYRDFSVAAAALNRLKKSGGIGGLLVEGVLPFTKTPINILRRGVEYSPAGILESIVTAAKEAKTEGSVDWARFIDRLSAGLTGTGVMIIGWLLSRMGWLRGKKDDKKEENFDKLQGYQDYSLQIGDLSMTIDWAAPGALPLFVGAAVDEALSGDGRLTGSDAWDAMMMITEPMLSLSMLEGLNNVISSASYTQDNQKVMTIAGSAIQSYLGQAFPTLLGQLARSIDGTRRSTYVDKNSQWPTGIQRFVQSSIQNKIPGWESQKTPYVDAWGREDTVSSKFLGALENFLSPSYINMVKSTDVDDELGRLYSAVTDSELKKSILPSTPDKKIGKRDLSADEYVALAKDAGSTKYTLLSQLIYDPRYLALSDDERAKAVKKIYEYASAAAKYHVDDTYDIRRAAVWIAEAEAMPTTTQTYERIWEAILNALKS